MAVVFGTYGVAVVIILGIKKAPGGRGFGWFVGLFYVDIANLVLRWKPVSAWFVFNPGFYDLARELNHVFY
jgi:hypothetical protein